MSSSPPRRVRVWDWPTRIVHWLFVLLIPLMWWTAEEEMMGRHRAIGYVLLGLLTFRILWGFLGSSTARFAAFVRGPRAVISYLNGRAARILGHNPLGGWSVMAMLGALSLQIGLGLFATDEDGLEAGPLSHLVSFDTAEEIADLHEDMFDVILVLIGVHLAAILFYWIVRRDNLVLPMLRGTTEGEAGAAPMEPAPLWRFLAAAALTAALTYWIAG